MKHDFTFTQDVLGNGGRLDCTCGFSEQVDVTKLTLAESPHDLLSNIVDAHRNDVEKQEQP